MFNFLTKSKYAKFDISTLFYLFENANYQIINGCKSSNNKNYRRKLELNRRYAPRDLATPCCDFKIFSSILKRKFGKM